MVLILFQVSLTLVLLALVVASWYASHCCACYHRLHFALRKPAAMGCQCKKLSGGDTIVCDFCASQMIAMLNAIVPGQAIATSIEEVMTPSEIVGMRSAVDGWMKGLQISQEAHTW